ncbi:hypothetical protein SAMN02910289_00840 [Lachnospiraceae bacterium RM5]|nr:hypothetical protein SAMN02910289_00840 [Lachnospiraceae bacterium RM5]
MSEEKKKLTDEELKKQIDELSDEELDKVAGGFEILREDIWCEMSYKFTEEETNKLLAHGFQIQPNRTYNIAEVIAMLNLIPQYIELITLNRHLSSGELGKVTEEMVQRVLEDILSK